MTSLDNFATGHRHNLDAVRNIVGESTWASLRLVEGDIRQLADCQATCTGA